MSVRKKAKCPLCGGLAYSEFNINGSRASIIDQEFTGKVICVDDEYWHSFCFNKQEKWWKAVKEMWAELSWHVKIDLALYPEPVRPDPRYTTLRQVAKRRK